MQALNAEGFSVTEVRVCAWCQRLEVSECLLIGVRRSWAEQLAARAAAAEAADVASKEAAENLAVKLATLKALDVRISSYLACLRSEAHFISKASQQFVPTQLHDVPCKHASHASLLSYVA